MKICVCICGLTRSIDLVIYKLNELFKDHIIEYILNLSDSEETEYINSQNKQINDLKISKKLYLKDYNFNNFRNSENYSNKIIHSLKLIQNNHDLYLIVRSDLILNSINLNIFEDNKLYFNNDSLNQFSSDKQCVCDNIIITKNYFLLIQLLNLHEFNQKHKNYLDINLYKYLEENKIDYELTNFDYKLILSECNIIAIAGDSGSGKTTLSKILNLLFENDISILETDRYHKWERGDENYQIYTHLNPNANYLEKMNKDIYQLKIGNEVHQVDYNHSTGKFTQKQKLKNNKNLVLCGLHTLYQKNMNELLNLKIYLDTDRELIKKWKIHRDVIERGHNLENILKQIEIREKDYNNYILEQKQNADIVINFHEQNNIIECNLIIQNNHFKNNILEKIIKHKYKIKNNANNNIIIKLKNNIDNIDCNIMKIIDANMNLFKYNYFKEILNIIYMLY